MRGKYFEAANPVVEELEKIRREGHSIGSVFVDWLDLMLYALQRRDDPYLATLDRYSEQSAEHFANAFGALQMACQETQGDILGVVYRKLSQNCDRLGQHFTPHRVAENMARLNLTGLEPDDLVERDDPLTIADPACGSGRLLILTAQTLPRPDGNWPGVEFHAQDKDPTCAKMATLNAVLYNLNAWVVHGDSLKVERRRIWRTKGSPLGGEIRELDDNEFETNPSPKEKDSRTEGSPTSTKQKDKQTSDVDESTVSVDATLDDFGVEKPS
jgi:hypothetical protein